MHKSWWLIYSGFFKMHFNIIFLSTSHSFKWPLSLMFPHNDHVCLYFIVDPGCTPHPLLSLHLIERKIFGEEWKLRISFLCKFLQHLLLSRGPRYLPGPSIIGNPQPIFSPWCGKSPFHIHKEQQRNLYFYIWKSILITILRPQIIKRKDLLFPHLK